MNCLRVALKHNIHYERLRIWQAVRGEPFKAVSGPSFQVAAIAEVDKHGARRFFAAAKTWWKDFLQIRPQHSGRAVKIFAVTLNPQP